MANFDEGAICSVRPDLHVSPDEGIPSSFNKICNITDSLCDYINWDTSDVLLSDTDDSGLPHNNSQFQIEISSYKFFGSKDFIPETQLPGVADSITGCFSFTFLRIFHIGISRGPELDQWNRIEMGMAVVHNNP